MSRRPISPLRKDLRAITTDGVAFSVMVGAGETYLPAFALAVGLGQVTAGLLASVPMLAGAVVQMVSPMAVRRLNSHKRWVVASATVQALSFVPLVVAAAMGRLPATWLYLIAALYWGAGMSTGAAWNTWVGTLVPPILRPRFFARRARLAHLAVLGGLVFGGLVLQMAHASRLEHVGFAGLFLLSGLARGVSAAALGSQRELEPPGDSTTHVRTVELLGRVRTGADAQLIVYLLAVQVCVQISGPYFTPFMLKQLQLHYGAYMTLMAASYMARFMVLPLFGRLASRYGARWLLWLGGLGIVPLSAMWLVSDSFLYLLLVQLVAGMVWAAYELATLLLVFESIEEAERTSILTTFNLGNALAMVGGGLLGGWLLSALGTDRTAYHVLFAVSAVVRLLTIVPLALVARRPLVPAVVQTSTVAVRPNLGAIDRPILPSLDIEGEHHVGMRE
jgi:MFS family permease